MNLTDPIWRACETWPERVAVLHAGRSMRYVELAAAGGVAAARLVQSGVRPADVLAMAFDNPLLELVVTLAAVRIGATVTPHKRNWSSTLKTALITRHRTRWLVGDDPQGDPVAQALGVRAIAAPALLERAGGTPVGPVPPVVRGLDGQPWRLWLSSGTTGTSKTIPQSHALGALGMSLVSAMAGAANQRLMVFADLAIGVAAMEVLAQLAQGGELVLPHSVELPQVLATLRATRPTRLVTTTGNAAHLVGHAQRASPQGGAGGDSLRCVLIAGSAVAPALRQGVARHLCDHIEVAYGSTEAGRMAVLTPAIHARQPQSAGQLVAWVQARAFDDSGQPLPAGQVGLLGFQSPTVFSGYLDDESTTAKALRGGWFFPGDRGSVDAAGFLTLHGRADEVLNLGGAKLDPSQIERVLDGQPGVRESAVMAVDGPGGRPVLVAVVVADGPIDAPALRRQCLTLLGPARVPRYVKAIDALPRNDAGKIDRRALAARLSIRPVPAPGSTEPKEE